MINSKKALRSFIYAWAGLVALFKYENNARVHFVAAVGVIFAGVYFDLTKIEWALISIAIGGVWAAEAFNTAIEKLCDLVEPNHNLIVKAAKDLAAAGVLIAALVALIIGVLVFGEKIISLYV